MTSTAIERLLPARSAFARLAIQAARPRGTALLWIALIGVFLATASYGSISADVTAIYLPAYTLAQHHTPNLDGYQNLTIWVSQIDGHWRSDRFPGPILLTVPAYWLFGSPDGVSSGPAVLTAAVATATTVALMHRTLLRLVGPGFALGGALVFALGTATWTVSADQVWTHTATQLGLSLAMYGLATKRPWLSGLGMVLSAAARPHTAVVAAVLGIGNFVRTRRISTALWLAGGTLLGFAIVLGWSGATLGHASLLPGTYTGRGTSAATAASTHSYGWATNLSGFLVSPERGILVLCPFVIPCLFGARRVWRTAPGWVRDAAIGAIVYSLVQLAANGFAGGWGFYSFRLALEGMTLATPLLVLGAREVCRSPRWAWATAILVGYSWSVHTVGAAWYVNVNEGPKWWSRYQPEQMARETPWHALAAIVIGAALALFVVALAWSDDREAAPRAEPIDGLSAEPAAT